MKMRDFSLEIYKELLILLKNKGYKFNTFEQFIKDDTFNKTVILRHDVDRKPDNAIKMAKLEAELNVKASYYYRIVSESYDENSIKKVVEFGHELGYHYEDLSLANGNYDKAFEKFKENLQTFRKLYPIKTMCMHGSPMSKWDNRLLWDKFDYKKYGIIAEPYFDVDFNKLFYITDASRAWNNEEVTLRDKVESDFKFEINSTNDILNLLKANKLPDKLMISTHPHNWAASYIEWLKIFIWQTLKNQIKKIIVKKSH